MKIDGWKLAFMIFLCVAGMAITSSAEDFKTIQSFDITNGAAPTTPVVQGPDGSLYGTTTEGGSASGSQGTVFRITRNGALQTLYSFCAQPNCTDGSTPATGLVLSTDGNLYGTTAHGGANCSPGCGTIFKISTSGVVKTVYNFGSLPNGADGIEPRGGLIQASDRNFYGTTNLGGQFGCGTVFRLTLQGALTTLHSFCATSTDGNSPFGNLVQGTDGYFYGTTQSGGAHANAGIVYRFSANGPLRTLYNFCSLTNCADGPNSVAGLIQGSDGNFYGTTASGGRGSGTAFKMTPSGVLTTVYSFCALGGCVDGASPQAPLIQATDGNFYGTTSGGGRPGCTSIGCGTVFSVTPGGVLTTIHAFCAQTSCTDGSQAQAALLQSTDGNLYGTTYGGGDNSDCSTIGCGTVFTFSEGLAPFVTFVNASAKVGQSVGVLGQGLQRTTSVSFNGTTATFIVESGGTLLIATVPAGATSGAVTVTTSSGTLTSNVAFEVLQ